jgi:hypothetical protein
MNAVESWCHEAVRTGRRNKLHVLRSLHHTSRDTHKAHATAFYSHHCI